MMTGETFTFPDLAALNPGFAPRVRVEGLLRYFQIPFRDRERSFDGADCRGLVLLILEHERGIVVPEPAQLYASTALRDAEALRDLFAGEAHRWRLVPDPEPWSVLLFGVESGGRMIPAHVGLSLGWGAFIHTQEGYGVQMAHLDEARRGEARWGRRLMGCYVYDA